MSAIKIYNSPYITMEYRQNENMIYHTVKKPIGEGQIQMLKDALNAGTDTLAQHNVKKWLSDDRLNGPLPEKFVEWSTQVWCTRTIKAGWKYWANVVPVELQAAGSLTPVINALYDMGAVDAFIHNHRRSSRMARLRRIISHLPPKSTGIFRGNFNFPA